MTLTTESQTICRKVCLSAMLSATHSTRAGPATGWRLTALAKPNSDLANKRNTATVTQRQSLHLNLYYAAREKGEIRQLRELVCEFRTETRTLRKTNSSTNHCMFRNWLKTSVSVQK